MNYSKLNYQTYFEKAIENNQLKLEEGKRQWRKFNLDISELIWARNFFNGWLIHVYDLDYHHLCSLKIGWEYRHLQPDQIKIEVENNVFENR